MTEYYYRFSSCCDTEEDLLDPERQSRSWQVGDTRAGVSATTGVLDLLRWAIDHHARDLDISQIVVMRGEVLGEDLDAVPGWIDAVVIRPTSVVEMAEVSTESIMGIARKYDGLDDWGLLAVAELLSRLEV